MKYILIKFPSSLSRGRSATLTFRDCGYCSIFSILTGKVLGISLYVTEPSHDYFYITSLIKKRGMKSAVLYEFSIIKSKDFIEVAELQQLRTSDFIPLRTHFFTPAGPTGGEQSIDKSDCLPSAERYWG